MGEVVSFEERYKKVRSLDEFQNEDGNFVEMPITSMRTVFSTWEVDLMSWQLIVLHLRKECEGLELVLAEMAAQKLPCFDFRGRPELDLMRRFNKSFALRKKKEVEDAVPTSKG